MKKALITGITGQDGSYLADLLLSKGYDVHGMVRRSSNFSTGRIDDLYHDRHDLENMNLQSKMTLHYGDLTDSLGIDRLIREIEPDEVYNLGAMSHVKVSFDVPEYTANADATGALRMLEALRNNAPKARFYQASSSEMFGKVQEIPQKETTPFYPRSPYGVAKLYGYWITRNYREAYDLHASNGILFNHESPRRGRTFVTRKITRGLANIKLGKQDALYMGNIDSKRDWGHAQDYVEMMWMMLQQDTPDDYVVATGEAHSVKEFIEIAGNLLDMEIVWEGEGVNEVGVDKKTGKTIVKIDAQYFRPTEVDFLLGDPTKAKQKLGWEPKHSFQQLVEEMVQFDLANEKDPKFNY